jgi:hypothetical protein
MCNDPDTQTVVKLNLAIKLTDPVFSINTCAIPQKLQTNVKTIHWQKEISSILWIKMLIHTLGLSIVIYFEEYLVRNCTNSLK